MVGTGSAVFHPESSRVARMASGGRHGLAQSIFQVGGNAGAAVGPLLAAWIVLPHGQRSIAWFSLLALLAMIVLAGVGVLVSPPAPASRSRWRRLPHGAAQAAGASRTAGGAAGADVLQVLLSRQHQQLPDLLSDAALRHRAPSRRSTTCSTSSFAVAAGTLLGGPIGDRIGRKQVIWVSILGVAPFTLALPYVGLGASVVLTMIIGFMLASAFPAIVVYAQELFPGKIGTISGLFFGLAFGLAGIGAAVLGQLADHVGHRHGLQALLFPAADRPAGGLPAGSCRRGRARRARRNPLGRDALVATRGCHAPSPTRAAASRPDRLPPQRVPCPVDESRPCLRIACPTVRAEGRPGERAPVENHLRGRGCVGRDGIGQGDRRVLDGVVPVVAGRLSVAVATGKPYRHQRALIALDRTSLPCQVGSVPSSMVTMSLDRVRRRPRAG